MAEQSPAPGAAAAADGDDGGGGGDEGDATGAAGTDDARVVGLESADAGEVIGAVSSDTGRAVLEALHDEPATASGLADRLDRSLQTVQYHLGNLADAGLVEVVGATTSEKGREMDVYGPTDSPVVVYAGGDDDADDLRAAVKRLVSGVAVLAVASLLVQELFAREPPAHAGVTAADAGEAAGAAGPEPGVVFFAGGVLVLVAYLAWWHLRRTGRLDGVVPGA